MDYASHPLYQAIEASTASSASYNFDNFVGTLAVYLKKQIDTPEEREKVVSVAMMAYDHFIAPRIPAVPAAALRTVLGPIINNILSQLSK
jgi:hypothetical protein